MKKKYVLTFFLAISLLNLSAQAPHFYGVTTNGGGDGLGTIFRTDTNGLNYSLIDSCEIIKDGSNPQAQQLVEAGGKLYGVTYGGGNKNRGVLFEYVPSTGVYTVKHSFGDSGSNPLCYLLLASNGNLYGTTQSGGNNNRGILFEYNITTGVFTKKIDFSTSTGHYPRGQMVESSTGVIVGTCYSGGIANRGTIYQYTISTNTLVKKDDFTDTINGSYPYGGLMKATNGKLYGMCNRGGENNYGTLYEFDFVTDSIKKRFDFDNTNGSNPYGNVTQGSNGKLYGTTYYGGSGRGVLFEYDITLDSVKKLQNFNTTNGYYSYGDLIESSPGKFLISMNSGGSNNSGTISEYTVATNTFVKKQSFDNLKNGQRPRGKLVKSSITNKYYGICGGGGAGNNGVLYEYDNVVDTLLNKKNLSTSEDGKQPSKNLLHASNGKLYGITYYGGSGHGVIFEVDPITNDVVKKADFNGDNGSNPRGNLVEVNGKIYGTTYVGGKNNYGVLYEYDLATAVITKLQELNYSGGYLSQSGLTKATNGKLYGVTEYGGLYGRGTLFEYDISLDSLRPRGYFGAIGKGTYSKARLLQATNGKLYGTTSRGGDNNKGTVFEFDFITDSIKTLAHFNDTNGAYPQGGLIQTSTGKLYGMTTGGNSIGSSYKDGVVYEFDLATDSILPRANFNRYNTGLGGYGELLESSNGKLYGLAGINGKLKISRAARGSKIVEFNPKTNSLLSVLTLTGTADGSLIELVAPNDASIDEKRITNEFLVYPNPTNSILTIDTKGERIIGVKIFDISGKLINSKLSSNKTLDVSQLTNGLYILQIETQNGTALSRFIKN